MLMYGAKLILKQYLKLFSSLLRAVNPGKCYFCLQQGSGWGMVLPIIGSHSWVLVLDSHSPSIHQALFGLWHAAPPGVFLWRLF